MNDRCSMARRILSLMAHTNQVLICPIMSAAMDSQPEHASIESGSDDPDVNGSAVANKQVAPSETTSSSLMRRNTTSTTFAETMEEGSACDREFIDYTPPPESPLPPPAKYKLWLVVLFLVFFASWFSGQAGIVEALSRSGYLNTHAALFVMLGIIVFVLTYAALDLMVHCLTFTFHGKEYGLGPWLKAPRLADKFRSDDNLAAEIAGALLNIFENGFEIFNPPVASHTQVAQQYECDYDGQVILKIEHVLKPDKWNEYYEWQKKIQRLAKSQPGLTEVNACEPEGDRQVIMVTFTSIDRLNEYMTSPARRKLMKKLEPLLMAPDTLQLQKDRDLPDAFTDLLTRQGECVPTLLPKKWKVWWLTTCGLFFVLLIQETVMPYYYAHWDLDTANGRLRGFVGALFATWFNSFVMTPFLMMIFSDWAKRKPNETDTKEPWRTLNDGLSNVWQKVFVTVAFYGGCVIAWVMKTK